MTEYIHTIMNHCAELVAAHITETENGPVADEALENAIRGYDDPEQTDFRYDDELANAVYFLRYIYPYAFEYSVIYDILFRDYGFNSFGTVSLGCGSCVDAWSMAYARYKMDMQTNLSIPDLLHLTYLGTDRSNWSIRFTENGRNGQTRLQQEFSYSLDYGPYDQSSFHGRYQKDIIDFIQNDTHYPNYNAIVFPKILNELPENTLSLLVSSIRERADLFKADRPHYIVISHAPKDYKNNPRMKHIASDIANAINYDGRFRITDNLPELWRGRAGRSLVDISQQEDLNCYEFSRNARNYFDSVECLNPDFLTPPRVREVRSRLNIILKNNGEHRCLTSTSASLFQIIKLEPCENETEAAA